MTQAMQSQQPGNIGETTLPMSAFETPVRSNDGFAGFPPEGQAYPAAVARSHKPLIITLIVVASLLLALVAAFFAARWYFSDRVAPGVHFGTVNVSPIPSRRRCPIPRSPSGTPMAGGSRPP